MGRGTQAIFILLGLTLIAAAVLLIKPASLDFSVLQMLLTSLGLFVILFGRAAKLPAIFLTIYAFAISFPVLVRMFVEDSYSKTATVPLVGLLSGLGYPIHNQGQWLHIITQSGGYITTLLTAACAGTESMGIFVALFVLMMLDKPLPPKRAAGLFAFGVLGTWFQNFVRLSFLTLGGYYLGDIPWTAHRYIIYFIFPLWYLFFAYIYFKQMKGLPERITNPTQ